MIARLGSKRVHHFAHKSDASSCSYETYLHISAKKTFLQTYQDCLAAKRPFYLEFPRRLICDCPNASGKHCDFGEFNDRFDLTIAFNQIEEEKKYGEFIPDLTLNGQNGVIFIEFKVTHAVEQKKISSGNKIIEIDIEDEQQVDRLRAPLLSHLDNDIHLINFEVKPKTEIRTASTCEKPRFGVFVKTDGSVLTDWFTEIWLNNNKNQILDWIELPDDTKGNELYLQSIAAMLSLKAKGIQIQNCHFCYLHKLGHLSFRKNTPGAYCKFYEKNIDSNAALECEFYRDDERWYSKI